MKSPVGRRIDDEAPGEFEFQRLARYPCEEHADWLKRLDDRLWMLIVVTCGGAVASLISLLVNLAHKGG